MIVFHIDTFIVGLDYKNSPFVLMEIKTLHQSLSFDLTATPV